MQTKPSPLTETVSRPTGIKMALLLFWEFIKLGAFTFGSGWSIIAQMEQEFVDKRHWVEQSDLLELIAADPAFRMTEEELAKTMDPSKYTGRSQVQVDAYLKNFVRPVLEENKELLGVKAEINV